MSTDDPKVHDLATRAGCSTYWRDEKLCRGDTSTDDLIKHVSELITEGHILWTHVTSPFVTAELYDDIIDDYLRGQSTYDSIMTATPITGFLWGVNGPENYDRNVEKWPRTQTLAPRYEITSGAFMTSAKVYRERQDRIGEHPRIYLVDKIVGMDIDWPIDFEIAETIWTGGIGGGHND